jgi:hypothetical protein
MLLVPNEMVIQGTVSVYYCYLMMLFHLKFVERGGKMIVIGEWVRIWKETTKILSRYLRGETEENHGPDSNWYL